jgi:hypothetical protein
MAVLLRPGTHAGEHGFGKVPTRALWGGAVSSRGALDERAARMSATRAAQLSAEAPPLRSLRAITYRHTTAMRPRLR